MAKGTIITLFFLAILASFLAGINIGKRIGQPGLDSSSPLTTYNLQPTTIPSPIPTKAKLPTAPATDNTDSPSATRNSSVQGTSTYIDKTCGFSFSYPGSYLRQKTVNQESVIFTDPGDPQKAIAATCAKEIPRPPVAVENIEAIVLDSEAATLYHDKDPDGNPRDEVIAKHPETEMEIIIAGYGPTFQEALSSFRFL